MSWPLNMPCECGHPYGDHSANGTNACLTGRSHVFDPGLCEKNCAAFRPVTRLPSAATLKKYGLSEAEWVALYNKQGGLCAICGKVPTTGRLVVDHEHVRGWKKMPPERRKAFVRGLLCWFDNLHVVGRGVTKDKLRAALAYLESFSTSSGK